MRRVVGILIALLALAGLAAIAADILAPPVEIGPGSVGLPPEIRAIEELAPDRECDPDASDEPCARRFAYSPDGSVIAWISVRNAGPLAVTLHGISQRWLDQFSDVVPLAVPVRGFDGGESFDAAANGPRRDTFTAITLDPGDERIVGVEFRVTDDTTFACEHWAEDTGVVWDYLVVEWSWLVVRHEKETHFETPLEFRAPTAADCGT